MTKKTAVVICPGRGTYASSQLGYLHQFHSDKMQIMSLIDNHRIEKNQCSIWDLDGKDKFSNKDHLSGENAAALIYACSFSDYLDINFSEYEIVAITGNSMGWYIACACAGVLDQKAAINVINTMGSQMKNGLIGGQLIYPEVNEAWTKDKNLSELIDKKMNEVNQLEDHMAYNSIYFGGLRVIGGNAKALKWLLGELPPVQERYPFILPGNAAFHTPLLSETSSLAKDILKSSLFSSPKIPLIDGRGKIWMPYSTDRDELWDYTLGEQVYDTYNFSKAIEVAVKEFAPDKLIITGPGMTLGSAVAQVLIENEVHDLKNKEDFKKHQLDNPYVLAMGDDLQRQLVI